MLCIRARLYRLRKHSFAAQYAKAVCFIFRGSARPVGTKMGYMKRVSIRELRYGFNGVERVLRDSEEIQVTKRGNVIARLTPEPID